MVHLIEFLVGQQYENRKGAYEVLAVQGDAMRIRWDSGEEIDTSVTMQSHIIERMQRPDQGKVSIQISEGSAPKSWRWTRR